MKKIIFSILALLSCAQINAQMIHFHKKEVKSLSNSITSNIYLKTMNGVSDNKAYTYSADFWTNNGYNTVDIYQKIDGVQGTSTLQKLQCTETNIFNFITQDNTYFSATLVQGDCMWGTRPDASAGIPLGQEIVLEDGTYELVWAPYNLGASSAADGGVFFAWGENGTEAAYCSKGKIRDNQLHGVVGLLGSYFSSIVTDPTPYFASGNYRYTGTGTTLPLEQDAAYVWWGGTNDGTNKVKKDTKGNDVLVNTWRMPTSDELKYLTQCTLSRSNDYYSFTKNGNSIQIPRVGYYNNGTNEDARGFFDRPKAFLLSNECDGNNSKCFVAYEQFYGLGYSSQTKITTELSKYQGASIRPVMYRKKAN